MEPFLFLTTACRELHSRASTLIVRGFTLVEMMVVLGIIVIITTVALVGQSSFNQTLILTDTAYSVALSLREAQSYGLSSKVFAASNFVQNAGYGIRFSGPSSYTMFVDSYPLEPGSTLGGICVGHDAAIGRPDARPGNCLYDPQADRDGLVQNITFTRGFTIGAICGNDGTALKRCYGSDFDNLDIVFQRPNTVSTIIGKRGSTYLKFTSASIEILAPGGAAQRCVTISQAGQITVVPTCP